MKALNGSHDAAIETLGVLEAIEFQANILALDAAIAAAGASESAAQPIAAESLLGDLARQTARSARDTATLIADTLDRSGGTRRKARPIRATTPVTAEGDSLEAKTWDSSAALTPDIPARVRVRSAERRLP